MMMLSVGDTQGMDVIEIAPTQIPNRRARDTAGSCPERAEASLLRMVVGPLVQVSRTL
jgi:hypothetical protein